MHLFSEVKKIPLKKFFDERGYFEEVYRDQGEGFVQINHSFSKKGVIRGLHFQKGEGQAKLITLLSGEIYDVFVDIRPYSKTFGKWGAYTLMSEKNEQLFIPKGFAHGFAALTENVHLIYQVDTFFNPALEGVIAYNDPAIGIQWPIDNPLLSEKDLKAPTLGQVFL